MTRTATLERRPSTGTTCACYYGEAGCPVCPDPAPVADVAASDAGSAAEEVAK